MCHLIQDALQGWRSVNLRNVEFFIINLRKIKTVNISEDIHFYTFCDMKKNKAYILLICNYFNISKLTVAPTYSKSKNMDV